MISVDLMSLWNTVCSVFLCSSVRNRTHPRYEITHKQLAGKFYLSRRTFFSHRTHRLNRTFLRTVSNSQNTQSFTETLSQPISQNVTANVSWKASVISVDLMSLWSFVCSVLLCSSVRKIKHLRVVGRFFSHRAHRVHWAFWRTFRAHRTPPAYRVHRTL